MDRKVALETARLTLRELAEEDFLQTNLYESDPDVVRWESHDPRTPDESRAYIRRVLEEQAGIPRRLWDLAVVRRSEGDLIGRCGLRVPEPEGREAVLWYVLRRDLWGKGYIPEAARALVDFGFCNLRLHRIFVDCDPRNQASIRVAEKLGMRREAHFVENLWFKGAWCDSAIYAVLEREWLR